MKLIIQKKKLIRIIWFMSEGRIPKDLSDYQNLIDLFINLRNGNENPSKS